MNTHADALTIAREALRRLNHDHAAAASDSEVNEEREESPLIPDSAFVQSDPIVMWRLRNAEHLTTSDLALGHDPGGFCAEHRRWLSWPEQKRGACSWCVPADAEREPEYWASHWRKFTERS